MRHLRTLATAPAVALAVTLSLTAYAPAADALAPPPERTVTDPADPGASYDVRSMTLRAATGPNARASVVVRHARAVRTGDAIDLWFDLRGDRRPDVYLSGVSFSEYAAYRVRGFRKSGRDITNRGCFALKMRERRSVVRFDPDCLGRSAAFAVSVRSFRIGEGGAGSDFVPGRRQLSGRVASTATARG
ncbi:hypothetical protein [Nocardioides dongkuii]|uniref:hypothetical protein n=1 Tax=Nocardioides dongkuii TaxID=2760089 RepID=UPI001878B246|nr:hypothetical protein [Nocardioides dongkuii]